MIGQALAETAYPKAPRTRHFERVFEFNADSGLRGVGRPPVAASATLITIAADEFLLLGFYVAEARDVDAVRTIAERHFVFVTRHFAACARAHVVIHEVVAEFAAAIGETVGKFGSRGIEEDARGLQRGSTNEKDARLEFERGLRLRIDDANTTDAASLRIEDETVNDAVRANREPPGFLRGGES